MDPGLRCGVQLEHAARISLLDHRSDRWTLLDRDLGTRGAARDRSLDHRREESRFAAKCPVNRLDGNGRSPGDRVHRGTRVPPLHKGVERCLDHILPGLSRLRPPPCGVVAAASLDTSLIRWNTHDSNTASLTRILSTGQGKVIGGKPREDLMFAVVVQEKGDATRVRGSGEHVAANVLPQVRQVPGIVSATWTTDEDGRTLNVLVFENEEAARMAVNRIRTAQRPPFMQVETVELRQVLAHF